MMIRLDINYLFALILGLGTWCSVCQDTVCWNTDRTRLAFQESSGTGSVINIYIFNLLLKIAHEKSKIQSVLPPLSFEK